MSECFYCEDGEKRKSLMIEICKLNYSTIYLNRNQKYPGRCVVKLNEHKTEYFQMTKEQRDGYFEELAATAKNPSLCSLVIWKYSVLCREMDTLKNWQLQQKQSLNCIIQIRSIMQHLGIWYLMYMYMLFLNIKMVQIGVIHLMIHRERKN